MPEQFSAPEPHSGVSRRSFLKGSGAAAAATALATGPGLAEGEAFAGTTATAEAKPLTLKVNGKNQTVTVEPRTTLLEALRYQLGLTGAKPISVDGKCGGSTVLLDGKPANATATLAMACQGKSITTAEALGGDKPDAVPNAFLHQDGMQCGFCTPGFVVAVRAFLTKNPKASEAEIRSGLNDNLCRCGTYANVIQAALEVVKGGGNG
jgi:xanthine dehydrogenase YagT iron-sulfur-binding subunit